MKKILILILSFVFLFAFVGCNNSEAKTENAESQTETEKVEIDNIVFNDLEVEYDGETHELVATNIPKGVKTEYIGKNVAKEIGDYEVTVVFYDEKDTYLGQKTATLKIVSKKTEETKTPVETIDPDDPYSGGEKLPSSSNTASNVQDGLILHAWNWSYKTIEDNLDKIIDAGYTTVQVSPVQQPKDYSASYGKGWAEQWWKLYQPLSFSIAEESWLGTKTELTSLCTAANKKGVKIIADIVANHVANKSNDSQADQQTIYAGDVQHKGVKDYESDLVSGKSSYFHSFVSCNDSSVQAVVQGNIGMPDLNTSSTFVQNMVIDLLKECIDCGIDGFRFDAAKHIETPDDGEYRSNFWPNVLTAATDYAKSKTNKSLYYYGEILNTPGSGRNWGSYTKYMSITDNKTGNEIRQAIVGKNASSASKSSYNTGESSNKLVLWAESHDTYGNANQESTNVSEANINKTWALVASRKGATALYLARPVEMGSVGSLAWSNSEVKAVNLLHNYFIGANEDLYSSGNYAIVERYDANKTGMVIVNCNGNSSSISLTSKHMKDGKYIDQITGNEFTVSGNKVTGQKGSTGIVVLYNSDMKHAPEITLSQNGGFFSQSLNLEIKLSFSSSAKVIINNKEQIINKSTTITLGAESKNYDKFNVKVIAINEDGYRRIVDVDFTRIDGVGNRTAIIEKIPSQFKTNYKIYAWVWKTGSEGKWIEAKTNGEYVTFDMPNDCNQFLLVTFNKNYTPTSSEAAWKMKVQQTKDEIFNQGKIYSFPLNSWK